MKFKYKDQIVTASSKVEAVKKITSDTKKGKIKSTGNPTLDMVKVTEFPIDRVELLLKKYCSFDKITIRKSSYIYAINNEVKYEIYISNAGKIEVTANINISNDNPTITKSFTFSSVGAKKLESWVISINSYLEAVKSADKLYSAL